MLISSDYRALNQRLHSERPDYGTSGQRWAQIVSTLMQEHDCVSVLDYGCGKQTLQKALGFPIRQYDPCIEEFSATPEPADLVACTDVLEHIEADCIDSVLDDLKRVTGKVGFFTIATGPAKKTLPDGRNAHVLQRPVTWWLPQIWERWHLLAYRDLGPEFLVIVK